MAATSLRWGIIGTGRIAGIFASEVEATPHARLVAIGSRAKQGADAFLPERTDLRRYDSYEALLEDKEVDAVYIATPHPFHPEWVQRAARAGNHILCEKPIALNHAHAMVMQEAVAWDGVFFMEAFTYRCHPQTEKLVELLRGGAIGRLRLIRAKFGFKAARNLEGRLLSPKLGGGAILDVGCYTTSMARLAAGAALGLGVAEPQKIVASGVIGDESGVDELSTAVLTFDGGIIAECVTGLSIPMKNQVSLHGEEGSILMENPWLCGKGPWKIIVEKGDERNVIEGDCPLPRYALVAEKIAKHLAEREAPYPAMNWKDTLGNLRTMDQWRQQLGLTYPQEAPENMPPPVSIHPVRALSSEDSNIPRAKLAHIEPLVSRLVMGVDNQITYPHAEVMFDAFLEAGGNAFDTAWLYGEGRMEALLGWWMRNRGVRKDLCVLAKGCHTPLNLPLFVERQANQSLERLQTDYADIYVLHRDNPEVPVDEWVDALNRLVSSGKARAIGGSNWTHERVDAFNEVARRKGLQPMSVLSNNFSLAQMPTPIWADCVSSSTPEGRQWLVERQIALLSWSSQAGGFFTIRSDTPQEKAGLLGKWYSEDNFERRRRATEVANRHGVQAVNVALAYVLQQPFPVFALIGPRTIEELRLSLPGLDVELSPEERQYLNLEVDTLP